MTYIDLTGSAIQYIYYTKTTDFFVIIEVLVSEVSNLLYPSLSFTNDIKFALQNGFTLHYVKDIYRI